MTKRRCSTFAQKGRIVERQCAEGVPVKSITRHILGLFNGLPGARLWRRSLSENAHRPGAGPAVILDALEQVSRQLESRGLAA